MADSAAPVHPSAFPHALAGASYWASVQRLPHSPIVGGSHYAVRVDVPLEHPYEWGRVFTSLAAAEAWHADLTERRPAAGYELARVIYAGGGRFTDVDF